MASSSADQVPDLPDAPYHPPSDFSFPKREILEKKQIVKSLCQSVWFNKWKWLHYCESNDHVLCHVCVRAVKSNRMSVKLTIATG